MQKQGLIARRRAPGDGRVVTLAVTAAGRRLTDRIVPIAERYERVAISGLSASETVQLKRLLRRLYANMTELDVQTSVRKREETNVTP
jgi:DNA-binding MarR family transcriptional regulator